MTNEFFIPSTSIAIQHIRFIVTFDGQDRREDRAAIQFRTVRKTNFLNALMACHRWELISNRQAVSCAGDNNFQIFTITEKLNISSTQIYELQDISVGIGRILIINKIRTIPFGIKIGIASGSARQGIIPTFTRNTVIIIRSK